MVNASIITIGDELLIGQVIDTNSAWIAKELNKIGFDVIYKATVGDNEQSIISAFDEAFSKSSVILVTGGIGPTKDDITKKTLCKYFNTNLIFNEDVLQNVKDIFCRSGRTINELSMNQAYVPEQCTVIQNKTGTAPCTWFERDGKVLVSMPGVPYEMKWLVSNEVISRLQTFFKQTDSIQHRTFLVHHYSESGLAIHLADFEKNLPENLNLAYLPSYGIIRLRITGKHANKDLLSSLMEEEKNKLFTLLKENIVAESEDSLEILLGNILKEKRLTLSVAESCTGGYISHKITSVSGSSSYFKGGIVSYANEIKENILDVKESELIQFGAVSEPVVQQMAKGVQRIFNTDCSIATSGIAGPDGGSEEKPVGTVWICARYKEKMVSGKFIFGISREMNIERASIAGLSMLYELIK